MFDKVYFYNHFHNGDIYLSKNLVKQALSIPQLQNAKFYYGHRNYPKILNDIPQIETNTQEYLDKVNNNFFNNKNDRYFIQDNCLYINTWYGSNNFNYMNRWLLTFDCLYHLFRDVYLELFNYDLNKIDPKTLYPSIDFDKFEIEHAKEFFNNRNDVVRVLVSNGDTLSGQSNNLNMNDLIYRLAESFHGTLFMVTNKVHPLLERDNIKYTQDIIRKNGNDLNENGYLSTLAHITVGRVSGVHSFAMNYKNMFVNKGDIVSFSDFTTQYNDFWIGEYFKNKMPLTGKCTNYSNQNHEFVFNVVSDLIRKHAVI